MKLLFTRIQEMRLIGEFGRVGLAVDALLVTKHGSIHLCRQTTVEIYTCTTCAASMDWRISKGITYIYKLFKRLYWKFIAVQMFWFLNNDFIYMWHQAYSPIRKSCYSFSQFCTNINTTNTLRNKTSIIPAIPNDLNELCWKT